MKPQIVDVCFPKPRSPDEVVGSKKYWYPVIGKGFMYPHSNKIDIQLDSVPLNWDGSLVVWLDPTRADDVAEKADK